MGEQLLFHLLLVLVLKQTLCYAASFDEILN